MIVEGQYTFPAPRQAVYDMLQDPAVLARALPGAKSLSQTGDGRFEGVMSVGVGPVTAAEFNVRVELADRVPPQSFVMKVDGKGSIGFTRGTATVALADGEGGTVLSYRADLQVGGKIASVGQRLLDSASKTMSRQGLEALSRELEQRLGVTRLETAATTGRNRVVRYASVALALFVALAAIGYCVGVAE